MSTGYRLTAEQSMLREALRELCATESTAAHVLEVWQEERPFDQGLWQALAANGWLGLCSDEAYGGAGLGIVELSLLAEELGRTAAAAPILPSLIAGLVTDIGSAVSHGAVVAREYGLPAVVNTRIATRVFRTGDRIVLDGESGVVRLAAPDRP